MLEYLPELLKGLHTSLTLTVASIVVALVLALIFTVILTLKTPVLVWLVRAYITLFTGTPLLVQIFLIYYGRDSFRRCKNIRYFGTCSLNHGYAP